jgi:hypothetical protein
MPITTTTTTIDLSNIAAWLGIAEPIYPIKETTLFPAYRNEKEAGYIQTRRRWTTPKKIWTLEWPEEIALSEVDFQILLAYFLANQGSSFSWTHYSTGVIYTVTFDQDELVGDIYHPGWRTTSVKLRQI